MNPVAYDNKSVATNVSVAGDSKPFYGRDVHVLTNEIRTRFIDYFKGRDHLQIEGVSVVPKNDPTLLYINSGMAAIKPYFTGDSIPLSPRLCNSQLCIRTGDIDDIGDIHHLTCFEMLGSWSIGDYGKKEAVEFAWELLTEVFGFPKERLYATVFSGDKETGIEYDKVSEKAWIKVGMPKERVVPLGKEDNLWGPAGEFGPCGPCTEVFFDMGDDYGAAYIPGKAETFDTQKRYVEIWNAGVFMEFNKTETGLKPLKFASVDTGSGLERMAMTMNGYKSVYETDALAPIVESVQMLFAGKKVNETAIRMIADHVRTTAVIIAEGVEPGNKNANYIPRRLIRKCVTAAITNGVANPDFTPVIEKVVEVTGQVLSKLIPRKERICTLVGKEVTNFTKIMTKATRQLDKIVLNDNMDLPGDKAHHVMSSLGLPLEFQKQYLGAKGIKIDMEQYNQAVEAHKAVSKK